MGGLCAATAVGSWSRIRRGLLYVSYAILASARTTPPELIVRVALLLLPQPARGASSLLLRIAPLRFSSHGATLRETRCNATNNCSRDELVEMQIESVERRTEQDGTERLTLAHQPSASPGQRNQESESIESSPMIGKIRN